jgi:hypothetical protein
MSQNHQHEMIVLDFYDGCLSGFSSGIPALPRPCRFECIARNPDELERVFIVAPIDPRDLERLCAVLGTRDTMPDPGSLTEAQNAEIDELLAATTHALTSPGAFLVWTDHINHCPERTCALGQHGARIANALANPSESAPADWADLRDAAHDWLEDSQKRLMTLGCDQEIAWLVKEIRRLRQLLAHLDTSHDG